MARTYLREDMVWAAPDESHRFLSGLATWTVPDLVIDENPWTVTFADLSSIDLASGVWDRPRARLEC